METPERVNRQPRPKFDMDSSNRQWFFKCPIGGFASLNPGICPKCNAQLVAVSVRDSSAVEPRAAGDGDHNRRSLKR